MSVPTSIPYASIQTLEVSGTASLPAASIGNSNITGSGSNSVSASKVEQQRNHVYSQNRNNFNIAEWEITHIVHGAAGTINTLKAKLPIKCTGADTVTVTWYLNGASIGTCTFVNADADNTVKTVAPSSTALVAGDDISTRITISGTNVGKGISAYANVTEYSA
jgi:hypothetical protein